jgi:urease subunit gamma/beta
MMLLSEAERDRLLVFLTAELARARRRRGLRLNAVEATALVADAVCEAARDGGRLADAIEAGRSVLTEPDLLPGVVRAVPEVRVEATFDDGTRLAVVRDPFRAGVAEVPEPAGMAGSVVVEVTNTAAVPISVTSHFHFFEANPRLRFDRAAAAGTRRTCSNWPAARTSSRPRPTRRCRSAGTRWPSTWT